MLGGEDLTSSVWGISLLYDVLLSSWIKAMAGMGVLTFVARPLLTSLSLDRGVGEVCIIAKWSVSCDGCYNVSSLAVLREVVKARWNEYRCDRRGSFFGDGIILVRRRRPTGLRLRLRSRKSRLRI